MKKTEIPYDHIIAIDPDVEKSGTAYLEMATRKLETASLAFPELLDFLRHQQEAARISNTRLIVVIEAGWLNASHWHTGRKDNNRLSAAKGNAVGRNHEVGRKIVEMCRHYGLEVIEQPPLRKCWKGKDGKITHQEIASFTGIMGRTNQDQRDAALIAWHFAELPIKPIFHD